MNLPLKIFVKIPLLFWFIFQMFKLLLILINKGVCLRVYLGTTCLVPKEARREHQSPGTGVTNSCDLSFGCWELNLGPLSE